MIKYNTMEIVAYATPKGYYVCDENLATLEEYEAGFPYKEKLKLPGQLF